MPKVSIIVPVCNVERYLEQCLRSAMAQTLFDIEILCIDDGSTDSCPDILDKLAREDARMRVVHKANAGYGHTMNMGLDLARGKYVVFLESDDYILPEMCQRMYDTCEQNEVEIVKADYYKFFEDKGQICKRYINTSAPENYHRVLEEREQDVMFSSERYTWICMYRRDFLNEHNIRHNETAGASFQDNGFWFQAMMYCCRMYFLDEAFYMYRLDNPGSSINNGTKIHACADEFAFVRKKIMAYPGDKVKLYMQSAAQDFGLHLWYFTRVDKNKMLELAEVLNQDIKAYFANPLFDIRRLDVYLSKKLLTCLSNPELFCYKVQEELDLRKKNYNMLNRYENIIFYGAGVYAKRMRTYIDMLMLWNKKFFCGVTSLQNEKEYFYDIKVQKMEDLREYGDKAAVLLCARKGSDYAQEMYDNLKKWGFENVLYAKDLVCEGVWDPVG